jgi:hypothetical protein
VTPEELLEPANMAMAEELDKAIDAKIGKFRTNKEVAEELPRNSAHCSGHPGISTTGTLIHSIRLRQRRRLL